MNPSNARIPPRLPSQGWIRRGGSDWPGRTVGGGSWDITAAAPGPNSSRSAGPHPAAPDASAPLSPRAPPAPRPAPAGGRLWSPAGRYLRGATGRLGAALRVSRRHGAGLPGQPQAVVGSVVSGLELIAYTCVGVTRPRRC